MSDQNQTPKIGQLELCFERRALVGNYLTPPWLIDVVGRILCLGDGKEIPIGRVVANKILALLRHVCIPKSYGLRVSPYKYGKQVWLDVEIDQVSRSFNIGELITENSEGRFSYDETEKRYKTVPAGPLGHIEGERSPLSRAKLDGFIGCILELYERMSASTKSSRAIQYPAKAPTMSAVFAGFVDLVGDYYPEAGLRTIAVLAEREIRMFFGGVQPTRKQKAELFLREILPAKLEVLESCSEAYLDAYAHLAKPGDMFSEELFLRTAVLRKNSHLLNLVRDTIRFLNSRIGDDSIDPSHLLQVAKRLLHITDVINLPDRRKRRLKHLWPGSGKYHSSESYDNSK